MLMSAVLALAAVVVAPASAQTFPSKPVHLIVPFSPGGTVDTAARLLQPGLQQALGQPVLVENKPGADGTVASALVAKSPPDGTTLLIVLETHAINAAIDPKLPYDTERDFAAVTLVGTIPYVILTNTQVPAKTLAEFVALARANPGKLNYASPASATRLAAELFNSQNGIKITHVAYRGGAPSVQSLVANETQVTYLPPFGAMPLIQGGQLRALAVAGPKRLAALPDVPTTAEAGFGGYEATTWIGMFAPAGTPNDNIRRVNAEVVRTLADTAFTQKFLDAQGVETSELSRAGPEQFAQFIKADWRAYEVAVKAAGIEKR